MSLARASIGGAYGRSLEIASLKERLGDVLFPMAGCTFTERECTAARCPSRISTANAAATSASNSGANSTAVRVIQGLGMGLDEKAVEAVRKWRFVPSDKIRAESAELRFNLCEVSG